MIKNAFVILLTANALALSGLLLIVLVRRIAVFWQSKNQASGGKNVGQLPREALGDQQEWILGHHAVVLPELQRERYGNSRSKF
jgi:hypothetical protein